jgi:hypothetical protein
MTGEQALFEMYEKMQRLRNEDGELLFPHLDAVTFVKMSEVLSTPPAEFWVLRASIGVTPHLPQLFQLLRDAYWYVVHHRHPEMN